METMGQVLDYLHASVLRSVPRIAVSKGEDPVFPTAPVCAAGQGAVGVNILVVGIGFPMRRFSPAGNYDAGAVGRPSPTGLNGRGQVH